MKTDRSSKRTLAGVLIILLAIAGFWAYLNKQAQRAQGEARDPLYQAMPVFKVLGVHLTGEDTHDLGEHKSLTLPFWRLDKRGQDALLAQVRKRYKGKVLKAVLDRAPKSLVGFQMTAPGSAYLIIPAGSGYLPPVPLHLVPGTRHQERIQIETGQEGQAAGERPGGARPGAGK